MSFDDEMVADLRAYTNDLDPTQYTYTDDQLIQFLLIAAKQVQKVYPFGTAYVANLVDETLVPDPTLPATRNDDFINLAVYRAAVVMVTAEIKLYGAQGIDIQEGTSRISLKRDPRGLELMLSSYQDAYNDALYQIKRGNGGTLGFGVTSFNGGHHHRFGWDGNPAGPGCRGWDR